MNVMEKEEIKRKSGLETWYLKVIGCPQCKGVLEPRDHYLRCNHCQTNYATDAGIPALLSPTLSSALEEGVAPVKNFYYAEERYDWTRDPRGLEFTYHRYRKWETWREIVKKLTPGSVVLDMGCGTGLITQQFIGRH